MSKDYDSCDYKATPPHSPMEAESAFWDQSDDPFAPGPIRQLPQTHTYWQSQNGAPLIRSSSHPRSTHSHRRIQKKQCSYDLHEDFVHHAHSGRRGSDDGAGSVSDVPSSPLSTLSYSTSSSQTSNSSNTPELLSGCEIQRCPPEVGSHRSTGSFHAQSSFSPSPLACQAKRQNTLAMVSKKNTSWPLLRIKSSNKPSQ